MEIVDERKEKHLTINALEILEKLVNAAPSKHFMGVKRIIIVDTDYKGRAIKGRWLKSKGDGRTEIFIMMDSFDGNTRDFLECEISIASELASTLFHEVYHHLQYSFKKRQRKKKLDEKKADEFAFKETVAILTKIYPPDKLLEWREKVYKLTEETDNSN